jgi:hypothetical protein
MSAPTPTPTPTQDLQQIKFALIHAAVRFDAKESKKRHYEAWALPQYLARINQICADIQKGAQVRAAVIAAFTGRLRSDCLRVLKLPQVTESERININWFYVPASQVK